MYGILIGRIGYEVRASNAVVWVPDFGGIDILEGAIFELDLETFTFAGGNGNDGGWHYINVVFPCLGSGFLEEDLEPTGWQLAS